MGLQNTTELRTRATHRSGNKDFRSGLEYQNTILFQIYVSRLPMDIVKYEYVIYKLIRVAI